MNFLKEKIHLFLFDFRKVFCKKQDMADNFEGDNIKQNTVVVAIVKNFDRIAANRVNVSMLNEDYAEKDLEEIFILKIYQHGKSENGLVRVLK